MKLFDVIQLQEPEVLPKNCKVHLAVWNGKHSPLDMYLKGEFEEWQSWQTKRNFQRPYIVSLIKISGNDKWLFAGLYKSIKCCHIKKHDLYRYDTQEVDSLKEYSGRLVVNFERTGRQSYLSAQNWAEQMSVLELKEQKLVIKDFPGYNKVNISKAHLEIVVGQSIPSWKAALSNIAGIYLITDTKTGKLYVGSATGDRGLWQRWADYSKRGHGGNKDLRRILNEKGKEYSNHFKYSILEIADTHTTFDDVLVRESYWKEVLQTREFGYNKN